MELHSVFNFRYPSSSMHEVAALTWTKKSNFSCGKQVEDKQRLVLGSVSSECWCSIHRLQVGLGFLFTARVACYEMPSSCVRYLLRGNKGLKFESEILLLPLPASVHQGLSAWFRAVALLWILHTASSCERRKKNIYYCTTRPLRSGVSLHGISNGMWCPSAPCVSLTFLLAEAALLLSFQSHWPAPTLCKWPWPQKTLPK